MIPFDIADVLCCQLEAFDSSAYEEWPGIQHLGYQGAFNKFGKDYQVIMEVHPDERVQWSVYDEVNCWSIYVGASFVIEQVAG